MLLFCKLTLDAKLFCGYVHLRLYGYSVLLDYPVLSDYPVLADHPVLAGLHYTCVHTLLNWKINMFYTDLVLVIIPKINSWVETLCIYLNCVYVAISFYNRRCKNIKLIKIFSHVYTNFLSSYCTFWFHKPMFLL